MRKKGTLLVAALFLITAVVLIYLDRSTTKDAEPVDPGALSAEQTADAAQDVSAITYSDGSQTLRFTRGQDGSWIWADMPRFPLDGSYPDLVAATVKNLPVLATLPLTEDAPLGDYGLDSSAVYLTYAADGGAITLTLGNLDDNGNVYVARSDDPANVYLTAGALRQELSVPIEQMMALPAFPTLTPDNVRTLSVTGENGATLEFTVTAASGSAVWTLDGADVTGREELTALWTALTTGSVDACLDYAPSDSAYALCGLGSPLASVSVTYVNSVNAEVVFTLSVGSQRGEDYCVTLSDDSTIYLMTAQTLAPVLSLAANGLSA